MPEPQQSSGQRQGRTGGEKRRKREAALQAKVLVQWLGLGRRGKRSLTKLVMKEPTDKSARENMKRLREVRADSASGRRLEPRAFSVLRSAT